MSSPAKEVPKDLKAGHAPAVKVGGMRVVQHKTPHEKPEAMTPEEEAEYGSSPKTDKHNQQVLVSGTIGKGDKDFKAEAVKVYHEKPQPAVQQKHNNPQHNIQQPRKQ